MHKFVKLDAIEKMAKPMEAFHEGEESEVENESEDMCECPKCGNMHSTSEDEDEYEEED